MNNRRDLGDSWVDGNFSDYDGSANESSEDQQEFRPERYTYQDSSKGRTRRRDRKANPSWNESTSLSSQLRMPTIEVQQSSRRRKHSAQKAPVSNSSHRVPNSTLRTSRQYSRSSQPSGAASSHTAGDQVVDVVKTCLRYALGILGHAMAYVQKPLGLIVALAMFYGLVMLTLNMFTNSVYRVLSPVCSIPGISYLHLPVCKGGEDMVGRPEFNTLMQTQSQFESMLSETTNRVGLPMELVRSERTIRDLKLSVKYSTLPSRNELVMELETFAGNVDLAGEKLGRFLTRVSGTAGRVISINRWTQRVLEEAAQKDLESGIVPSFLSKVLLAPVGLGPVSSEKRIVDQYIQHTQTVSGYIGTLLDEAHEVLALLNQLDNGLDSMGELALKDRVATTGSKSELLRDIRTYIGLRRGDWSKYNDQLDLLKSFGEYRTLATQYVSAVIVDLQKMKHDLSELKEQVEIPAKAAEAGLPVPLSVHMESIQQSIDRLEHGKYMHNEVWKAQYANWRTGIEGEGDAKHKYLPAM